MKFFLLAAAAVIAVPAIAQQQTVPQTSDPATQGPVAAPADTPAPTDPALPADTTATPPTDTTAAPPADTSTAPAPTDPNAADPAGGYAPTQPALSGTPQPGATVVFKQAPSPSEAFPPPPPQASYPICKKGQFDGCRQRGGK